WPSDEGKEAKSGRTVQSTIDPRRVVVASMLLLQVLMAILATAQLMEVVNEWLAMGIVAIVYIIFGLGLPRAVAGINSEPLLQRVLRMGRTGSVILSPVEFLVDRCAGLFAAILPAGEEEPESYGLEEEILPRHPE